MGSDDLDALDILPKDAFVPSVPSASVLSLTALATLLLGTGTRRLPARSYEP